MSFEEHLLEYRFFDKHLLLSSIKADWFFLHINTKCSQVSDKSIKCIHFLGVYAQSTYTAYEKARLTAWGFFMKFLLPGTSLGYILQKDCITVQYLLYQHELSSVLLPYCSIVPALLWTPNFTDSIFWRLWIVSKRYPPLAEQIVLDDHQISMASGKMKHFQVYFLSSMFVRENQLHTLTAGEMSGRLYPSHTKRG